MGVPPYSCSTKTANIFFRRRRRRPTKPRSNHLSTPKCLSFFPRIFCSLSILPRMSKTSCQSWIGDGATVVIHIHEVNAKKG